MLVAGKRNNPAHSYNYSDISKIEITQMKGDEMKKYLVEFNVVEGKIPLIKLVRNLTDASLVNAKDYVENYLNDNNGYDSRVIEFLVAEDQLGQFLIRDHIYPSAAYSIVRIEELKEYRAVDLTQMKGRR